MDSRDLEILTPTLRKSIKKIIQKANFTQYDVTVRNLSTRGDNFLGKLYEIIIKGTTPENEKEVNLFVKEKFILKEMKAINVEQIYASEKLIYKDISKIMSSLQDQADVPLEDRFRIAKAYDETSNDAIILENLCNKGFKTYGKTESVSLKFMQLGVQAIAKFHAFSFIIENKMPEYFEENIVVIESPLNLDNDWDEMMRNICRYVANLYHDEIKTKIEKFVPILLEKLPRYLSDRTNICTLSHGDYKKNNVMFRMNGDEVIEVVPIDYQIMDYGCPIRDLLYFIFTGTEREFRKKHLEDLKELYFQTLSRFLRYFDMDVETVYPRKEFERIYTEWLDFGLMMTLYASIVLYAPDTGLDFENRSYKDFPFNPDKKGEETLRGLVDDFVEWGCL